MSEILVSISCITYNHSAYIRQCLDGMLMQQTTFGFEILIHDDCSTDGTENIIREYASKYPQIIKPLYEEENQYQNGKPFGSIVWNIPRAKGKYIAFCEGDDYWTDPLKLQKSVDFLESHPDYGFIGSKCLIRKGNELFEDKYPLGNYVLENGIELYGDIFKSYAIYGPVTRTCTLLYKKSLLDDKKYANGDYSLQAILASKSKFARLSDYSSVYRVHSTGVSHNKTSKGILSYNQWFVNQRKQLNQLFPEVCKFNEDELNDLLEYRKMQIALSELKYLDFIEAKKKISTQKYKNKNLVRFVVGRTSFYILGMVVKFKNK